MDYKAKQASILATCKAMQAANLHLIPATGADSLTTAAKNARIELKRAFPGVKFSVKTSRFSGGDSMTVSWTDGPNGDQVDLIIDAYAAGTFNGSDDSYNYDDNAWTAAFGDAKYVHGTRHYSDAAITGAIRTIRTKYEGNLSARGITEIAVEDFKAGKLYNVEVMTGANAYHYGLQSLINRELARRTWSLDKTPAAKEMADAEKAEA